MGLDLEYIEGQTPLEDYEKEGLIIKSITTRGELDELEQYNIHKAELWSRSRKFKKEEILTEHFIKHLHQKMYSEVWRWAGTFRKSGKNIGVDWVNIGINLKYLLDDMLFWIDKKTHSADEATIRFKHKLVSIHCFPNGNGRHSRLMADIIIDNIFGEKQFSWGTSNLVKAGSTRKRYILALREADQGNYHPLIEFARS